MADLPPGPRGLDLLRTIAGRRTDPVQLLVDLRERYGDIVHVRVGDTSQFLLANPDDVKHVFVDNHRNYTKGPGYQLLASLLGEGLVTAEGETWKRHRRMVQPSLQRDRMHAFVGLMATAAAEESQRISALAEGETVDVFALMMALTLRIVARTLLGTDLGGREAELHGAMTEVLDHIERLSTSPLRFLELLPGGSRLRGIRRRLSSLPTARHRAFREAIDVLDRMIFEVIARRRRASEGGQGGRDLVGSLLAARDESVGEAGASSRPLSDREIRDEVMTMFIAGHETTATALTWCFYLLAVHPEARERLRREATEVLGTRAPGFDDLPRLVVAQRTFEEAMRLYPPVWRISRFATGADRIRRYEVRAGSVVVVSPFLLHRDATLWENPEQFDPDRFTPERSRARTRLAFIPFGAGQRMCIGAAFATAEAQVILSTLCQSVAFELLPDRGPPVFEPRVTLRPAGGMPMRVRRLTTTDRAR